MVIIGGNGAGKSTLFNAISGDYPIHKGRIILNGVDISNWPRHRSAALIAKVVQDPRVATIDQMTIEENLSFAYLRGQRRGFVPHKNKDRSLFFQEKLQQLEMGLEARLNELMINLSGGQRQAISLIMALLADSEVLLLDEITAALDPKMANLVMKIADKIVRDSKRTTLMITHNMSHALQYGDRTLLLKDGQIIREFSKETKERLKPVDLAAIFSEEILEV